MYAINDYACEAIANLPLSGDMQPSFLSQMLGLLPVGHKPCFYFQAAFLKCLPSNVRAHLVHDRTSNSLTLALQADKIFQSCVSSASNVNHVSSASVLGDDYSVHAVFPLSSSQPPCSSTPGPSSRRAPASPSASRHCDLPSLCWYHRSHAEKAQKCHVRCSWFGI